MFPSTHFLDSKMGVAKRLSIWNETGRGLCACALRSFCPSWRISGGEKESRLFFLCLLISLFCASTLIVSDFRLHHHLFLKSARAFYYFYFFDVYFYFSHNGSSRRGWRCPDIRARRTSLASPWVHGTNIWFLWGALGRRTENQMHQITFLHAQACIAGSQGYFATLCVLMFAL